MLRSLNAEGSRDVRFHIMPAKGGEEAATAMRRGHLSTGVARARDIAENGA
jgi:hypothetical protein